MISNEVNHWIRHCNLTQGNLFKNIIVHDDLLIDLAGFILNIEYDFNDVNYKERKIIHFSYNDDTPYGYLRMKSALDLFYKLTDQAKAYNNNLWC